MNIFVLKNTFIKIYIYHFSIDIFIKNKKSKLCFGDRAVVQNDFFSSNFIKQKIKPTKMRIPWKKI